MKIAIVNTGVKVLIGLLISFQNYTFVCTNVPVKAMKKIPGDHVKNSAEPHPSFS